MRKENKEVMKFLLERRSQPSITLKAPFPSHDELLPILTAAARVPDHGMLFPWRFIVLEGSALKRLSELTTSLGEKLGKPKDKTAKIGRDYQLAGCVVAVIYSPKTSDKMIPEEEQVLAVGAVCMEMVNMALASGWGANWLTGWIAHNRLFLTEALSLNESEYVAGFIHVGSITTIPQDRKRPDIGDITEWMDQ